MGEHREGNETGRSSREREGWADKSKYYDWKVEDVYVRYIPSGLTEYHIVVSGSGIGKTNLLFSSEGRLIKDNSTL